MFEWWEMGWDGRKRLGGSTGFIVEMLSWGEITGSNVMIPWLAAVGRGRNFVTCFLGSSKGTPTAMDRHDTA